ncbi:MAG: hypothetical protein PHR01_09405, partial [Sphaerochaetaceae bacterium]|nr:hypothetical protein [Sphaerochaetaceae bacterium]
EEHNQIVLVPTIKNKTSRIRMMRKIKIPGLSGNKISTMACHSPFEPPTFGPFGPGGAPPDPGLGNIFGNFYNNFGGPMGFGGMGGTPFMGW